MEDKQHITRHKIITMQYSLTTAQGMVVREVSVSAVKYLHGAGILFPKLEQALERHVVGDIVKARLLPDDAFGRRAGELACQVPVNEFPPGERIKIGATIVGGDEAGEEVSLPCPTSATGVARFDANHPLAGQTLVIRIEIQGIRNASGEVISRGEVPE